MLQNLKSWKGAALGGLTTMFVVLSTGYANAAASPTTGIDYVTDLVTPVKSELTLAIVAGLGLAAVIMAVKVGFRFIKSFGK
jgi:hypothetical protein